MALEEEIDGMFRPDPADTGKRTQEIQSAVDAVFNTTEMAQKGVITGNQAFHLVRATIFADHFNSPLMSALVSALLRFSVSKGGRGRLDLSKLLQAIMHSDENEDKSIRKRLLGA